MAVLNPPQNGAVLVSNSSFGFLPVADITPIVSPAGLSTAEIVDNPTPATIVFPGNVLAAPNASQLAADPAVGYATSG